MTTSRPDWPKLAPAPRAIPFGAWFGVRIGESVAQFGLLVLSFGIVFCSAFLPRTDIAGLWRYRGELETTSGRVSAVEATGASEGGRRRGRGVRVQRIEFEFEHAGATRSATSYGPVAPPEPGDEVSVEFPVGRPELARIRGLRSDLHGSATLMSLVFPLTGLAMLIAINVRASRFLRLARDGRSTLARVKAIEFRRRRKGNEYHDVHYEFDAEGQVIAGTETTTKRARYEDGRGLRVLYDPRDPKRHFLVDEFSVPLVVDALGRIQPPARSRLLLAMIVPALFVLTSLGAAVWLFVS